MTLKVARRLKYGWKIYYEPEEREVYRRACKHNHMCICDNGYHCFTYSNPRSRVVDSILIGCTPNVECPLLKRWDTRHGIERGVEYQDS